MAEKLLRLARSAPGLIQFVPQERAVGFCRGFSSHNADKHSYRKSHSSVCEMLMKSDCEPHLAQRLGEIIVITL